jgi:hypothetical protein
MGTVRTCTPKMPAKRDANSGCGPNGKTRIVKRAQSQRKRAKYQEFDFGRSATTNPCVRYDLSPLGSLKPAVNDCRRSFHNISNFLGWTCRWFRFTFGAHAVQKCSAGNMSKPSQQSKPPPRLTPLALQLGLLLFAFVLSGSVRHRRRVRPHLAKR